MKAKQLKVGDKVFIKDRPKQYGIVKRVGGSWITLYVYNRYGDTKLIQAVGAFVREQLRVAPTAPGNRMRDKVLAHYDRMIAWAETQTEQITSVSLHYGTGESIGPGDCPLCQRYAYEPQVTPCFGCPVHNRTGVRACMTSPWELLYRRLKENSSNADIVAAFKAEREFLAGLDYSEVSR